jgi:hypothetical protein
VTRLSLGHGVTINTLEPEEGVARPIVVIAGWLGARERQLRVFREFYHDRGCDTLTFAAGPLEVLMPSRGEKLMRHVMHTVVESMKDGDRAVVFHGFSVAGYLYGLGLIEQHRTPKRWERFTRNVRLQAFDSPPDFENIALGVGASMGFRGVLSLYATRLLDLYLFLTRHGAGKKYRASSAALHDNTLAVPSIFFYSKSDPVAEHSACARVAELWRGRGNDVREVVWDESPHIAHAKLDGTRYFAELETFLEKHGLLASRCLRKE